MATPEEIRRAREATAYGGIFNNFFAQNRAYRNRLAQQGRRPVLGGLLSKEPVMGTDTLRYEGIRPFVGNLLEPFIKGGDTVRASRAGLIPQEDMLGEAFGAAGAAMLGGGFAPKPAGSLGANALFTRKPNNIMDEFRPETYYHGTRSDIEYFDPNMVDLGVHVGTKGQANERLNDLVKKESPVYSGGIFGAFDLPEGHASRTPDSAFVTGEGSAENAQILPLKVRADYPLRMPDVGEWDRSEVVMYYIEKMLGEDGDPRLKEAFADFDFDELDDVRDQFYDNDEWKASVENREFLDEIRDRIKDAGYDSIVYKNAVESSRDEGIQDSMIILDPSNLRSVNAEFDPAYSRYPDLLAANASKAGGLLAAAQTGERYFADDALQSYKRQANNPKSRETITYMSPQQFLNLAEKTSAGEKTKNTRKLLQEGKKFSDIPFLSVENQGSGVAQVVGHEGRNRMMALAEAGVESVPVRLNMLAGKGPPIRWGTSTDPNSFDYVDPKDIPVRLINQDKNMVYQMPDSSVYPVVSKAPVRKGLLDTGPYTKPRAKLKTTDEMKQLEKELEEYLLLNEILGDYE